MNLIEFENQPGNIQAEELKLEENKKQEKNDKNNKDEKDEKEVFFQSAIIPERIKIKKKK